MLALALSSAAAADPGRVAVGLSGAAGGTLVEPSWVWRGGAAGATACAGLAGWWVSGGHDYAGSRGEVRHTPDDHRVGVTGSVCPTSAGGLAGSAGVAYGRQAGDVMYVTTHLTLGVSAYQQYGPEGQRYRAFGPYAEPVFAAGLALPPGVSIEVGPILHLAPPLLQTVQTPRPSGSYWGSFGLQATVLVGAASPRSPTR